MRFKGDNRMLDRLEKGMMGANKTRNAFALLAVVLTTFMITTVSVSYTHLDVYKRQEMGRRFALSAYHIAQRVFKFN